jgi:hypothetical protein
MLHWQSIIKFGEYCTAVTLVATPPYALGITSLVLCQADVLCKTACVASDTCTLAPSCVVVLLLLLLLLL